MSVLAFAFVRLPARSLWVVFPLSTSTDGRPQARLGPMGARRAQPWGVGIVTGLCTVFLILQYLVLTFNHW